MRTEPQELLTIICLGDEKIALRSVPHVVVSRARKLGLAGATVLIERNPHDRRGWLKRTFRPRKPTVIEIVESQGKIEAVLSRLLAGVPSTVVVMRESVDVVVAP